MCRDTLAVFRRRYNARLKRSRLFMKKKEYPRLPRKETRRQTWRHPAPQLRLGSSISARPRKVGDLRPPSCSISVHACSDLWLAPLADVPTYRFEPAKSSRSECKAKGAALKCKTKGDEAPSYIKTGELRVGILYKETGSYGLW